MIVFWVVNSLNNVKQLPRVLIESPGRVIIPAVSKFFKLQMMLMKFLTDQVVVDKMGVWVLIAIDFLEH